MDPISTGLLAASTGASLYGMFGPKQGPNYAGIDALYARRRQEIGDFAAQLTGARQKYLTSLGSMYDKAFARFSGNAEAGFAARGLQVGGGAFASALAKETSRYQSELEPLAYNAEREDLRTIDDRYAAAAGMNAEGRKEGAKMEFLAGREDSEAIGRLLGTLTSYSLATKGFGYGGTGGGTESWNIGSGSLSGPRTGTRYGGKTVWDDSFGGR